MNIDINEIKQSVNIIDVIGAEINLKKIKANEYIGKCPFHDDTRASLTVSEAKQIFCCFVCDSKGDVFDFYTKQGLKLSEAVKRVQGDLDTGVLSVSKIDTKKYNKKFTDSKTMVFNVPEFSHMSMGNPDGKWIYRSESGAIKTIISRYDKTDGDKIYLPYSFLNDGTSDGWFWKQIPLNRPLYNLNKIIRNPKARIILVEGEKTADAVQSQFSEENTIATTWIGGAKAMGKTDFSPLNERDVIKWPDNDKAGIEAMIQVPVSGSYINVPQHYPKKWDAADKTWLEHEMDDFINTNASEIPVKYAVESKKKKQKKDSLTSLAENHFTCLGVENLNGVNYYHIFVKKLKQVMKYPTSAFKSKTNYYEIAPITFWEKSFENKYGFSTDQATNWIFNKCQQKLINNSTKRGVGCFIDNSEFVFFNGEYIFTQTKKIHCFNFESNFYYELSEISDRIDFSITNPMNDLDAQKLLSFFKQIKFDNLNQNNLLSGWVSLQSFVSVLRWRPHIWIIGEAGKGKSWVMDNVIHKWSNNMSIKMQGMTSQAGLRNRISGTGRSVIVDEMDAGGKPAKDRIEEIIELARSSSYRDSGGIYKADTKGGGIMYEIHSSFCFASIEESLIKRSDMDRFSVLSINNSIGKNEFITFEKNYNYFTTSKSIKSFMARTFLNLESIIENSEIFAEILSEKLSAREADQIGFLLAGYYNLYKTGVVHKSTAKKIIDRHSENETDEVEKREYSDNQNLLNQILGHQHRYSMSGFQDYTIANLMTIELGEEDEILPPVAHKTLSSYGIKISHDREYFYVINSHIKIYKTILSDSQFGIKYHEILRRIDGAEKTGTIRFAPGIVGRATKIPIEYIYPEKTPGFEMMGNEDITPAGSDIDYSDDPMKNINKLPF